MVKQVPRPKPSPKPKSVMMWINHLNLLAGDPSVVTSYNAINSGVGTGLSGLIIQSTTTGSTAQGGGIKVVERGLEIPPGFKLTGVRVGYENSNPRSSFSGIRLSQVVTPPGTASVLLDDTTLLNAAGPTYADSSSTSIDPAKGPLVLSLRVNFGNTGDRIILRGLGLHLVPA
jgi:hypothetical protein